MSERMGHQILLLALAGLALVGCGVDYGRQPVGPVAVLTTVALSVVDSSVEVGQFTNAVASPRDQFGDAIAAGPVTFTSSNAGIAAVQPNDGRILGISEGQATITATVGGKSASRVVTVAFPAIFINEVAPLDDATSGFVELFNPTSVPINLTGWTVSNANIFLAVTIPGGTVIPAGGFVVLDESLFPAGLGGSGFVHLFSAFGVQSDAFAWGHDPITSYGRCPDGQSALVVTEARSPGTANACF